MISKSAMVVLSGGQDSTTSLFWAKAQGFSPLFAVTFNYGQRHSREIDAAHAIAGHAGVAVHDVVNIPDILQSRSPLTSENDLEMYTDYESMDRIIGDRVELTFVPMRNALFLTVAANRALWFDCYDLVTGVCQQDNANYPDCRRSFVDLQESTINLALGISNFRIHTPLMELTKAQTVRLAKELPGCWEAIAESHTCYSGKFPPCGTCHACVLRAEGFRQAGLPDPLIERAQAA